MMGTVGRVVGLGAGMLATAATVAVVYTKTADDSKRIEELEQALKASQEETRSLMQAYKLLLAHSASQTQQATVLQNAAAGLRTCLSRAERQQAQLQESICIFADYVSLANERKQQLEEDLAAALEENTAKAAHIKRLESEVLQMRVTANKQQASHSTQVEELEAKHKGLVGYQHGLNCWYNKAARDAAGAEAARDAKAEQLALVQQQLESMKARILCLADSTGRCSIRSSSSNSSSIFPAPHSLAQSDGSDSSESSGRRRSSSSSSSSSQYEYGTSEEGSGSACCDCGECASCAGALSPRAAELQMLCDVELTSEDEDSDSDSDSDEDEEQEDGSSRNLRVQGATGFALGLDMGKVAACNEFGDSYQQDPTAVSLVHVLQSNGAAAVTVPKFKAALQHITDSSCGFEAFSDTAAAVFVGACEAYAVEQPTGGDAAAAVQPAAVAEAGAREIVRAEGAADWWGSAAMRMAGAVVACGGPVLAAAEMQQLLDGVEQLGEKLDSLAELFHALPGLADMLFD